MTLSSLIASDVSGVIFDTNDFASTVTREITGNRTRTESQTVILMEAGETQANRDRGKAVLHDNEMLVDDSTTVTINDTYLIAAERFKVLTVSKSQDGLRRVTLTRVESERTEARATRVLR